MDNQKPLDTNNQVQTSIAKQFKTVNGVTFEISVNVSCKVVSIDTTSDTNNDSQALLNTYIKDSGKNIAVDALNSYCARVGNYYGVNTGTNTDTDFMRWL